MPTKRQKRSEKRLKNIKKQRQKYPLLVKKILENSDIILEVLDARFIKNTRNLELEKEIEKQHKKIIYVLNKSDLIDQKKTKTQHDFSKLFPYAFISCRKRKGVKNLRNLIKRISKTIEKTDKISVGVIGYPNTGKSSMINLLIGKKSAKTGAEAGFTKGVQKLKLTPEIMLLDSPGVIPEADYSNINKSAIAKHTIVGGRSHSQVKNPEMVIAKLMNEFKGVLEKHYKIQAKEDSEILIKKLGEKKGFLKKEGQVNEDKTARFILKEWQEGKIKVEKNL